MTTPTVLEPISQQGCEALLANGSVGRVAVVVDGEPHVVPVNYVADGATIVFQTASDTILTAGVLRKVAFEVDAIHNKRRSGWSVCVHGHAREITNRLDPRSRRLRELFVDCWLPAGRDRSFEIVPEKVTGRYLGPPRPA